MNMKTLVVNFSGGRSSGLMVAEILENPVYNRFKKLFVFCNTGCEHPKTLEFVHRCEQHFGIDLVWLEGVTQPVPGVGIRAKVVNFETAARQGEPFADMISKHGLPNIATPHCTRELKSRTTLAYLRSQGLQNRDLVMAMGFRADETRRHNLDKPIEEIYPLALLGADKADVVSWWETMPFDLEIEEHQGNCVWCWKKSDAKHFLNLIENPHFYDFPDKMERLHARTALKPVERQRTLFRDMRPTKVLRAQAELMAMDPAVLRRLIRREYGGDCTSECHPVYS